MTLATFTHQLEPAGAEANWTVLLLWAALALAALIAAVFLFPRRHAARRTALLIGSTASLVLAVVAGALAVGALQGVERFHISGYVANQGVVDGRTWITLDTMPIPVLWDGPEVPDGGRLGGVCTEGSPVAGIEWTCTSGH